MRTPIAIFRSNTNAKKFNHQELNESVESQIDLNILTQEEQDSLDSNGEMVTIEDVAKLKLADPRWAKICRRDSRNFLNLDNFRSPVDPEIETELTRTPIISSDVKTKKEDNLMKKITEKLISANLDDNKPTEDKPKKSRTKNLIYEDGENTDRYSTPPKKSLKDELNARTPLGCLGNTPTFTASTPKSKQMIGNQSSASRIPVSARRLHWTSFHLFTQF